MSIREELLADAPQNVGEMLRLRVEKTPDKPAFMYPDGAAGVNRWTTLTWRETN